MSDCSQHKRDIAGITDMKQLAEMIGDLHYETLRNLLGELADKLHDDHFKDLYGGRTKLAEQLKDASNEIWSARMRIAEAWDLSKPFMPLPSPPNSK